MRESLVDRRKEAEGGGRGAGWPSVKIRSLYEDTLDNPHFYINHVQNKVESGPILGSQNHPKIKKKVEVRQQ